MKIKNQAITDQIILDMLGIVLIEIRAHTNPDYAKHMADIFHNVPARLIRKTPAQEIYEDMLQVANRLGLEKYLGDLLHHSQNKFKHHNLK
jgi:hypothetical protein